jgi:hypothetical protein
MDIESLIKENTNQLSDFSEERLQNAIDLYGTDREVNVTELDVLREELQRHRINAVTRAEIYAIITALKILVSTRKNRI